MKTINQLKFKNEYEAEDFSDQLDTFDLSSDYFSSIKKECFSCLFSYFAKDFIREKFKKSNFSVFRLTTGDNQYWLFECEKVIFQFSKQSYIIKNTGNLNNEIVLKSLISFYFEFHLFLENRILSEEKLALFNELKKHKYIKTQLIKNKINNFD
jgi:hypothetical protein